MKMPAHLPQISRQPSRGSALVHLGRNDDGLSQQGCDWFRCAKAVAECIMNPDPKRCILNIAPNCLDCL